MPKKTSPKPTGRRISDESAEPVPKDKDLDWSDYMFGSYNPDEDRIALHRLSPLEYQGVPTAGWLDDVSPPGIDESYIREHYGGGKFHLIKRNRHSGKITASCTFVLPGFPKVILASADPKEAGDGTAAAAPSVMLDVGGAQVPFAGDLKTLADFVLAMKAIKSIFPDPIDVNAQLLELALKRDTTTTDPLETVRTLKEAVELFAGQTQTGSNVYDLVQAAIQQAGPVIQAMVSPPLRRASSVPVLPRPGSGNGAGKEPVPISLTSANKPENNIEPTDKEVPLILAVASTVMACWKLDPPKGVSETVTMVDLILQQEDATIRKTLADGHSGTILTICETGLADEWLMEDSHVGGRKEFGEFFREVFAEYARADRGVMNL